MTIEIPAEPTWLRVGSAAMRPVGVDFDQKAILGMVVAQEGPFLEDPPRGEFDKKSLKEIVKLGNARRGGLKSNFTHGSLSGDSLGNYLGRVKNLRMDTVTVERPEGLVTLDAVRGDHFMSDVAFDTPSGDLAGWVLRMADEDSDAISSSLVLQYEEEWRLDKKTGRPALGENGKPLPALWRPTALHGADIVDKGAAVDGLLSANIKLDGLNDALVRKGCELLNGFLPGQPRKVVEARLSAWIDRALSMRFGDEPEGDELSDTLSYFEARLAMRKRISRK